MNKKAYVGISLDYFNDQGRLVRIGAVVVGNQVKYQRHLTEEEKNEGVKLSNWFKLTDLREAKGSWLATFGRFYRDIEIPKGHNGVLDKAFESFVAAQPKPEPAEMVQTEAVEAVETETKAEKPISATETRREQPKVELRKDRTRNGVRSEETMSNIEAGRAAISARLDQARQVAKHPGTGGQFRFAAA